MTHYSQNLIADPDSNFLFLLSDSIVSAHTPNGRASGTIDTDNFDSTGCAIVISCDEPEPVYPCTEFTLADLYDREIGTPLVCLIVLLACFGAINNGLVTF